MARVLAPVLLCLCLFFGLTSPGLATETVASEYYQLGDNWDYTLIHEIKVANPSSQPATDITVTVPLMDKEQPAYNQLVGSELDPYPHLVYTDGQGRRFARYQISYLPGYGSLTLTQKFALNISAISYVFDPSQVADEYSPEELAALAPYLAPTATAQSNDSRVQQLVSTTLATEADPYRKARLLFGAVNQAALYEEGGGQSAVDVLQRGTANCDGYTNLYLAALRAAGVPCRRLSGYLYQPDKHLSSQYVDTANGRWLLDELGHSWVEFYLPAIGWVMADPTFTYTFTINGEIHRFVDLSYFASITTGRRYFYFRMGDVQDKVLLTAATGQPQVDISASFIPGRDYLPFADVSGHWAKDAILFCAESKLFNGVTASTFAPDAAMTRAMFVAVLGRLYELTVGSLEGYVLAEGRFPDVRGNEYYAPYLAWAVEQGLIDGMGDGRFAPEDNITRQQMAKIIAGYMHMLGQPLVGGASGFSDSADIAQWAKSGVDGCATSGLITGLPNNRFAPNLNASRAQVATIVERMAEKVGYR